MTSTPVSRRGLLASAGAFLPADRPARRPNILFALADDWMWPFASIGGDKVVRTPVFDRVARNGVLFTNAYVSAPSCSPSRAAMLTGQYHWRLEQGANLGVHLPSRFEVYPDLLEAAGYHVGFTRKGWGPGNFEAGGRKRNPAGNQYPDFAAFLAARPKDRPFCFWFGSHDPHRPYPWESGVGSGMKLDDVKVPPYLPDCETVRKDICDYSLEVQRFDSETGALLAAIERSGELDNTIVVMSGDNGWPFPRGKASLYEAGTHVPLAISWPGKAAGGRTVQDFVSLSDLAPTFLEAAGLEPRPSMTARSLVSLLQSKGQGWVDPKRDRVLTGMERHVPCRGENLGGYGMRALRNRDFHFIRNFRPERWPYGDPGVEPYTYEELARNTRVAFADSDAGPTKAHLVQHRSEPAVRPLFELTFGQRPARELYDLRNDPYQLRNVAADPKYAADLKRLDGQLSSALAATADPRVGPNGDIFDTYENLLPAGARKAAGARKKR